MTSAVYVSAENPVQVTLMFGCAVLNSSTILNQAPRSAGRNCSHDIRRTVVLPPDLLALAPELEVEVDEHPAAAAAASPAPAESSFRRLKFRLWLAPPSPGSSGFRSAMSCLP